MRQLFALWALTIALLWWAAASAQVLVFIAVEDTVSATPWTPDMSSQITSWYDFSDDGTVTEAGDVISAVTDKIGSNDLAGCTAGSGGPDHVPASDYADFASGECLEELSATNGTTNEMLAIMVAEFDTLSTGQAAYWQEANSGDPRGAGLHGFMVVYGTSGSPMRQFDGYTALYGSTTGATAWENNGFVIVASQNDNGTGQFWVNGDPGTSSTGWAGENNIDIVLGGGGTTGGQGDETWRLKEAFWAVGWTSSPKDCLEGYLADKHGITLDAGHPYAGGPPTTASGCP